MSTAEDLGLPSINNRYEQTRSAMRGDSNQTFDAAAFEMRQHPEEYFFTHPVYRHWYGSENLTQIAIKSFTGDRTVWFSNRPHFRHLGRLEKFDGEEINQISSQAFSRGLTDFLVMPELPVAHAGLEKIRFPKLVFPTQSNWKLDISADHFGLTPKNQKNYAYRYKRLVKTLGREPQFVFRKSTTDDFNLVYNTAYRRQLENGVKPHGGNEKRREMEAVSEVIGYFAGCFVGDTFIAGNIMYVANDRGFGILTAMNTDFIKCSPGLIVHKFTMQSLLDMGITEVNLMWGDSPYKKSLGAVEERLCTVIVARSLMSYAKPGFISAALPSAITGLKRKIRAAQRSLQQKKR